MRISADERDALLRSRARMIFAQLVVDTDIDRDVYVPARADIFSIANGIKNPATEREWSRDWEAMQARF